MSIRPADQRGLDLFETLSAHGVKPDPVSLEIADNLISEAAKRMQRGISHSLACQQALQFWGIDEYEWEPWAEFLDKSFGRRGGYKTSLASRPFAPLSTYEDGRY